MKVLYIPPKMQIRPVRMECNLCQTQGNVIPGVGGESPDPWNDDDN